MQSRNSTASDESKTVNVKDSEPVPVGQENGKASGLASPPATTVAVDASEMDPFMVQIDKNDPTRAMVCVFPPPSIFVAGQD